jgi:metal-responsive CopG/Arc/MetJ family transcriptional regulator
MTRNRRISISLPADLVATIDRECHVRNETRSQFTCVAVEDFLHRERERELDSLYVQAYRDFPESEEEVAEAETIAIRVLAELPWDEDDAHAEQHQETG